ncbi:MAG TPA: thioesterase family protein [Mesorhizobium sp.]|jgi:acyl-CoA thioester hydrolase|nr:thioesterase family protein [Mesorhizobium sp.]
MFAPEPLVSRSMEIEPAWIDYNGHLNMAFYNVLMDRGADEALEALGMGLDYVRGRKLTIYTAEVHVSYVRELHLGDRVTAHFQLLDHDEKRLHSFQELRHADGWLAATSENLMLHVDMEGPRVTPFPADILPHLHELRAAHSGLPKPERAGRAIGIRRKA